MIKKILNLIKLKGRNDATCKLKKYKGIFSSGTAEYTYLENPNGGRIYEGKFKFVGKIEHGTARGEAEGRFRNNVKHGEWLYKRNRNISLKMNYHQGNPEGAYELCSSSLQYPESLSCSIANGKLQESISGSNIGFSWKEKGASKEYFTRVRLKGQFNEEGHCQGDWTFEDMVNLNIFHAVFENGVCQTFMREDTATGDYTAGSALVQPILFDILKDNFARLEKIVNRNCVAWHLEEICR